MCDDYRESLRQIAGAEGGTFDIVLRQAEVRDAKAVLGLIRHIGRDTDYMVFDETGAGMSVEAEERLIQQYLQAETSIMVLVEADDQIIGLGEVATYPQPKQAHVAEIGISLVKEYWGYGIASMLLEELIGFAQEVGLEVLTLEVVRENERGIKLYEKFNFQIVGSLNRRLKSDHHYYDTYIMERIL